MPDLATLLSQLSGSNQQPPSDPGAAVLKLARASLDALVLRLGQTIDARVVGELPAGLTQLSAGGETFVLRLEAPLPPGTAVTIRVTPTPQGMSAVTVSVPAPPAQAPPLPIPVPAAPLVQAQSQPAAVQLLQQATQVPLAQAVPMPAGQVAPQPVAIASQPTPGPSTHVAQAVPPATPQAGTAPPPPPGAATPQGVVPPGATSVTPQSQPTVTIPPAAQVPLPVTVPPSQPVAASHPVMPQTPPEGAGRPMPAAQPSPNPATATPAPVALSSPAAVAAVQPQAMPSVASPYPASSPPPAAQQLPLPAGARPAAPPLNLADPAQAAARQDSAAPLLAKLAMLVAATVSPLPRPVLDAAQRVLANRIDLNRAVPDGRALEAAVLKSGVVTTPTTREAPANSKSALLALRTSLLAVLGGDGAAPVEPVARAAPPIKGEPPRAPAPQAALADPAADGPETARTLLGHTDAALSRLKLLQAAAQPAEARADGPVPRTELRVEIPMLLGTQTGILQLMVERDGKHKRDQERQRGWRMRFAMNFSETGEVGADIALLGRAASISIWAAAPETANALDEMLPELAPAIQRHGLELTSLRVRRGAPKATRTTPGRLLDSAR